MSGRRWHRWHLAAGLAALAGVASWGAAGSRAASPPAPAASPSPAASPAPRPHPAPTVAPSAPEGGRPSGSPTADPAAPRLIDLHVGIPGYVFLGQTLQDLTTRFPRAGVTPFAGQQDALVVSIPEEGLSCYVVGPSPDQLQVASIGFNFDQTYMGAREGNFRTREGIGKGSTINDLLGTYGKPAEVSGDRSTKPLMRRNAQGDDADTPKKYQYASSDGATKSYFVVQYDRVLRVVINNLAPLERHLLKRPPEK